MTLVYYTNSPGNVLSQLVRYTLLSSGACDDASVHAPVDTEAKHDPADEDDPEGDPHVDVVERRRRLPRRLHDLCLLLRLVDLVVRARGELDVLDALEPREALDLGGQRAGRDLREPRGGEQRGPEVARGEHEARDRDADEGVREPERDGGVERVGGGVVLQLARGGRDDDDGRLDDGLCGQTMGQRDESGARVCGAYS